MDRLTLNNIIKHLKGILLPALVVAYPVLYLYSQNVQVLRPRNLVVPLAVGLAAAAAAYTLFFFFQRRVVKASISAAIFCVFFSFYGMLYYRLEPALRPRLQAWLQPWLQTRPELSSLLDAPDPHLVLLPAAALITGLLAYAVSRIRYRTAAGLRNLLLIIMLGLASINIVAIVPPEIRKARAHPVEKQSPPPAAAARPNAPDIYYIILDEYAGFDAVRGYWQEDYVDDFEEFLEDRGFYVAGKSQSKSTSTMIELNSRLNMKIPNITDNAVQFADITDNRLLRTAKAYGYTTVVINKGLPSFNADYNFSYLEISFEGFGAREYRQVLLENSMLSAFTALFRASDDELAKERDSTMYGFRKTTDLAEIASPKFVFTYIPFPHMPFIVDQHGHLIHPKYQYNWNYYIDQHHYATEQARAMITRLLKDADPQNPPVIILQSDHGARNVKVESAGSVILKNYPREYETLILNALYLPGYDYTKLAEDLSPIVAVEIVTRHYIEGED